jgi:Zn-dependent protease with chaperone function
MGPHEQATNSATRAALAMTLALALVWLPVAQAQRSKLKPGWNLYSPQADVELGRGAAQEAEKQLPLLNDARVDRYIDHLGKQLARVAPGEKYPYQFKVINDKGINAFALPGGFIYVNRGIIEAADNEAQLAGVIGHEIGHVALRHGTNQASKAQLTQGLLVLGGALAGSGTAGALAQVGGSLFASGILLKYGRDAERQSDILGTQMLYDLNYDPRAMAQFFEKLEGASKGKRPPEFLSSHPNPGNRMRGVMAEIDKMGAFPKNPRTDSPEFRSIKAYVQSLPAPKPGGKPAGGDGGGGGRDSASAGPPPAPSTRLRAFENRAVRLQHPDNWQVSAEEAGASFVPPGGVIQDFLAYGVILNVYTPQNARATHQQAHDELITVLQRTNARMRVYRRTEAVAVGPQRARALSTLLVNDSATGGRELDWLVTVSGSSGLTYFVFVVPEKDAEHYQAAFQAMLDSARFGPSAR